MPVSQEFVSTSFSLLDRIRQDDQQAWVRLCQLYAPCIYHWVRQCGLQDEDAADISQDVFASVARATGEFREDDSNSTFRGWLWMITRNKIRDHFRKQHGVVAAGGSAAQLQMQNLPDGLDGFVDIAAEHRHLAQRALALIETDFEARTWQAFLRTAVEGEPASRTAEELGMSVGSVYVAKSRVLQRLRSELDGLL